MNSALDKIYDKFGKDICLFPFYTGWYSLKTSGPNNLRPCPNIEGSWDIVNGSLNETLNNDNWRNIRKNFIEGSCRTNRGCSTCAQAEDHNSDSIRQSNNHAFAENTDIDHISEIQQIIDNDYQVNRVISLDVFPSNYCNYSCIMCNGQASSSRNTFEVKFLNGQPNQTFNTFDSDFYQLLHSVNVINFTGGETILQPQVHVIIDYLIDNDLAKNLTLTMLTNVSSFPDKLADKFKKFKRVNYTLSIDGVGDVIEYQRRGAEWSTVETNAIKINKNFGSVINYVVTAVNVFSFDKFIAWAAANGFDIIYISIEDSTRYLDAGSIPDELKIPLIERLSNEKSKYTNIYYVNLLDKVINILNSYEYKSNQMKEFVHRIRIEDRESKKPLIDVVPEWKPYFE